MKPKHIFLIVAAVVAFLTMPVWLAFLANLPNAKSNYVDYVIEQDIVFKDRTHELLEVELPYLCTYVWQDGEIIYSEYSTIESDSTAIKARTKAKRWVQMIKNNEQ